MSFDTAVEKYSGHTADQQGDNNSSSRGLTRVFTTLSSDPANDTCLGAKLATGIPRWRDAHPDDTYMRASDINAQRISPVLFEVSVTYTSPTGEDDQNPLDEPAKYRFTHVASEEEIDQDINGELIATECGETFDPAVRDTFYDTVITVTKNLASYDPLFAGDYINSTNDATFNLANAAFPRGSVLITGFDGEEVIDDDFSYFVQTITFQVRITFDEDVVPQREVWWKRILHQGMYCFVDDKKVLATVNGQNAVKPVLLADDGTLLPEGDTPVWKVFQRKLEQDFNQIQGLE